MKKYPSPTLRITIEIKSSRNEGGGVLFYLEKPLNYPQVPGTPKVNQELKVLLKCLVTTKILKD